MITDPRLVYKPFENPQAESYWAKQQQAHWLHFEVSMASDINDWKVNMSESEKKVVGSVLKGFTQMEVLVGDYWAKNVAKWFPKPEIVGMASTFSAFESIHAASYSHLNSTLGLDDFDAFLYEPTAKAKVDYLMEVGDSGSKEDIARSLAIFSALTEGVTLFSSFAILLSFSTRNLLKGVGEIITFSVRDESLHSEAGCWLYNQFMKENKGLRSKELVHDIQTAARTILDMEHAFIDMCFSEGDIPGLDKNDLKNYITYRTNTKLSDINIPKIRRKVDLDAVKRMQWFDILSSGKEHQDFFAQRVTEYSKGAVDWDTAFEGMD